VYFILITVVLDTMGAGLLIPVLPKLIATLAGASLASASVYGGEISALFAAVQFLVAPLLGNLSDRFGRRPILLFSLAAFGINYLIMGWATSIVWLFISQTFAGAFGATTATAGAYMADVTPGPERAHRFALIGAAMGIGIIVGPIVGGFLSHFGLRLPFFVAAGMSLLNVAYGTLILPESHPREKRRAFSLRRAHVLGAFRHLRKIPLVFQILGCSLLMRFALQTVPATWPYFTMQQFKWTPLIVGYSLAIYGTTSILGHGFLVKRLVRRLGSRWCTLIAQSASIVGFVGFALSRSGTMALAFIVPTGLGYMSGPAMTGIMSLRTPAEQQGELQGAIASLTSLSMIVTPPIMTHIFHRFSAGVDGVVLPGAQYLAAAALAATSLALFWRATRGYSAQENVPRTLAAVPAPVRTPEP
jgi:DHA1 family tetracycline resistance protein-like MFS transporter